MTIGLAQSLWTAPLADPAAVVADLSRQLSTLDYADALMALGALVRHGLPAADVSEAALARWPWSVDLGWLVFETTRNPDPLADVVRTQGRRWGTLAWALWMAGRCDEALDVTAHLDPAAPSHAADRVAQAELRVLADQPAPAIDGPDGLRLSLLATWRREGGHALAQRFDCEAASLPAHPPLWAFLIDAFVNERDFNRANDALTRLRTGCGATHPETLAQAIRLALEAEDAPTARALLDALPSTPAWDWGARRHAQDLRCRQLETALGADPQAFVARAAAALRLYPRHPSLIGLHRAAREAVEDWDVLINEPTCDAGALIRMGRADLALTQADSAPCQPDDFFRRQIRRVEAYLRLGQLAMAQQALPPPPAAVPLRAELAWWRAEVALATRDLGAAKAALTPALTDSPTRMGLHLSAARAAFFEADFGRAQTHLATFRRLKTAQLGQTPPDDLRDRIVADGLTRSEGPAVAARAFALSTPPFQGVDGAPIPPRIAHYWEGPRSAPVERGLRAWGALMPQQVFDASSARGWLVLNAADLVALFDRQTLPATRADLFRVALIAHEGGLFADLDEYPRASITDWLTGARAVLVIEEGHGTIANNFLAALPGLPLFARLQARIASALAANPSPYPWWDSGPAPLTIEAAFTLRDPAEARGLRFLTQPEYDARVATNLPFPHKAGPLHWR